MRTRPDEVEIDVSVDVEATLRANGAGPLLGVIEDAAALRAVEPLVVWREVLDEIARSDPDDAPDVLLASIVRRIGVTSRDLGGRRPDTVGPGLRRAATRETG